MAAVREPGSAAEKGGSERGANKLMRGLVAFAVAGLLGGAWLITAALLPSCVERMARQHPPFKLNGLGAMAASGCGQLSADEHGNCPGAAGFTPHQLTEEPLEAPSRYPERGLPALRGTLTLPASASSQLPGVLLLHGSGPNTRDGDSRGGLVVHHPSFKLYQALAEQLAAADLAVLRYDKRSCRACYPEHTQVGKDFRFSHFEDDAQDALAALAKHPRVDPARLILVGHSQGGQLAAFVAQPDANVVAVITLAGQLDNMEHSLLGQLDAFAQLRLQQFDPLGWANLKWARRGYASCFDKLRAAYVANEICLGGGVTQQALLEEQARGTTTREQLATLSMPLLMLQGNLDRNIAPEDFEGMRERLAGRNASIQLLDKVGHGFVHHGDIESPKLAPEAIAAMLAFLASIPQSTP